MSYHQTYKGEIEIREGLEKALPGARFKYVWLDTKINKKGGPEKAKEAIELYQEFKPDGVIAADDSAQELFVVPYLKDKEPVPVVFCGVNFEAGKYGYPAGNVTGVLEKKHYREGISFAQLIDRNVEKIAVVYIENRTNRQNLSQLREEADSYQAKIVNYYRVERIDQLKELMTRLEALTNLRAVADEHEPTGYRIEADLGAYRGWQSVPEW